MTRPIDVARKLCPQGKASYLAAIENGDGLFRQHGITTPLRLAHFLAQCMHETGGLTIEWESGNYTAERLMQIFGVGHHSAAVTASEAQQLAHNGPAIFERVYGLGNPKKAHELGNLSPGDGFRYRGAGIMQTTGRANYRRMGQKCGVDFEGHPELVLSAEHALKPALAEWTEGNLNAAADRDDILTITKRINGGTNGLDDRKHWLARLKPLISSVELSASIQPSSPPMQTIPPAIKPASPQIQPQALEIKPTVTPPSPSNTSRNSTAGVIVVVGAAAATVAPDFKWIAITVGVAIAVAVVAFLLWPKKKP